MKTSVFSKLVATYIVITIISFVAIATFLSIWFEGYYYEQRRNQLITASRGISGDAKQYLNGEMTREKLQGTLAFTSRYLSGDIWLLDAYGITYAISDEVKFKEQLGTQFDPQTLDELRFGKTIERRGTYGNLYPMPVYSFERPIISDGLYYGAIMFNTPITEINAPLKRVYQIIWITAVVAIISFSIVIYYFSQKIIINPLGQMNQVAQRIAKGEVDKRVNINTEDEIGQLARSFNMMADSLEEVDKNRRDFISNVSHELRSPITSIKGFIGGILDGVIPKEKENYYLSITYEETQRLTRLVNDLLDLSAMEAGKFKLSIRSLDINELIRRIILKFETKLHTKRLKVDVVLTGNQLFVKGDPDRITQVITNLLDNAIKYVEEGGNVKITTKTRGPKAYISVFNNGPTIEKEDINRIWDRFYKADKARTTKASTGLGLPIVRNILTQHGEDIWAENKEGEGVTFTFTLTLEE